MKKGKKKQIVDLSNAKLTFDRRVRKRHLLSKIFIITKWFRKRKINGIFNFLMLLGVDKYISILKLSLLLFPLILISIFANFIIATITTGIDAILCSILYIWLEKIIFKNKNKFFLRNKAIHKKKKILATLIICSMNIISTYLAIKYQVQLMNVLVNL